MIKWQAFSFYMPNALPSIVSLQKAVFEKLDEPLVQVQDSCSHGEFLTRTMRDCLGKLDAVVFFDLDCIPLKQGISEKAVRLALKCRMVIGCAHQANHLEERKIVEKRHRLPFPARKLAGARHRLYQLLGWDPITLKDPFYLRRALFSRGAHIYLRIRGKPDLGNYAEVRPCWGTDNRVPGTWYTREMLTADILSRSQVQARQCPTVWARHNLRQLYFPRLRNDLSKQRRIHFLVQEILPTNRQPWQDSDANSRSARIIRIRCKTAAAEFLCAGLGWDARSSPQRLSRLRVASLLGKR